MYACPWLNGHILDVPRTSIKTQSMVNLWPPPPPAGLLLMGFVSHGNNILINHAKHTLYFTLAWPYWVFHFRGASALAHDNSRAYSRCEEARHALLLFALFEVEGKSDKNPYSSFGFNYVNAFWSNVRSLLMINFFSKIYVELSNWHWHWGLIKYYISLRASHYVLCRLIIHDFSYIRARWLIRSILEKSFTRDGKKWN